VAENLRLFARLERVADPDAVVARMARAEPAWPAARTTSSGACRAATASA